MKTNPIFLLIEQFQQQILGNTLQPRHFEETNAPYYLVSLSTPNGTLRINHQSVEMVEHHITVPRDIRPEEKSHYHYTLQINTEQGPKKIHIHFGATDNITIEPLLFPLNATANTKPTKLSADDIDAVLNIAMPIITPIILRAREQQTAAFNRLLPQVNHCETQLVAFSQNILNPDYKTQLEQQIQLHQQIVALGYDAYMPVLRCYQVILQHLKQRPATVAQAMPDVAVEPTESHSLPLTAHDIAHELAQAMAAVTLAADEKEADQLVNACNAAITQFEASKDKPADIKKIIQLASNCLALTIDEDKRSQALAAALSRLLSCHIQLKETVSKYFTSSKDLMTVRNIYIEACKANLVEMKDTFIRQVLDKDDSKFLLELVSKGFIRESQTFQLSDNPTQRYTLVEWCAKLSRPKCLEALISHGCSFDFLDEQSPLGGIMKTQRDCLQYFSLIKNPVGRSSLMRAIKRRINALTVAAAAVTSDLPPTTLALKNNTTCVGNEKERLQMECDLLELSLQAVDLMLKKPTCGFKEYLEIGNIFSVGNGQDQTKVRAIDEACKSDYSVQCYQLSYMRQCIRLMHLIEPKYKHLLNLDGEQYSSFTTAFTEILYRSPEPVALYMIKSLYQQSREVFEIYIKMIQDDIINNVDADGTIKYHMKNRAQKTKADQYKMQLNDCKRSQLAFVREVSDPAFALTFLVNKDGANVVDMFNGLNFFVNDLLEIASLPSETDEQKQLIINRMSGGQQLLTQFQTSVDKLQTPQMAQITSSIGESARANAQPHQLAFSDDTQSIKTEHKLLNN